jgi:putative transposase
MIRVEVKESVGKYLSKLMDLERTEFFGRQWYEHALGDVNHRNGSYSRNFTLKGIGAVKVEVSRDRKGEFETRVIPRSKQYEVELRQDLSLMFLTGVSTRVLSMMSEQLIGRKVSQTEVSNANKELIEAVEKWRPRDLSGEPIRYIFLDGVNFDMRISGSIEKVPVRVAIGVSKTGRKRVLGFQAGVKSQLPPGWSFSKI